MKKAFLIFFLFLAACSQVEEPTQNDREIKQSASTENGEKLKINSVNESGHKAAIASSHSNTAERKVMYTANLSAEVKHLEKTIANLVKTAEDAGGYMVHSNVTELENSIEADITFRIPQKEFHRFLNEVKKASKTVHSQQITGEDATEEYVDFKSRLKAKQAVEARLLDLMKTAKNTEDLLKISHDLAAVQEEIEQIKGRIKYIDNKTDYATVELHLNEKRENLAKNLNIWEKTKNQLIKSTHWMIQLASWLIVFVIGNLPVILLLLIVYFLFYRMYKKRKGE